MKMVTNSSLITCEKGNEYRHLGIFNGYNPLDSTFPLLLLDYSSIMIVTSIVRFLLKPLRQPNVVSQAIGGIILGPSVLSRNNKFQKHMFPSSTVYLIKNLGTIGLMYFLFVSGVKMDVFAIRKADKKHWYIGVVSVIVPLACTVTVAVIEGLSLAEGSAKPSSIWGMSSSISISAFPVLYRIVRELNLISSEMGQMGLSTAVIGDVIGMSGIGIFEAAKQGEAKPLAALWYLISLILLLGVLLYGFRKVMLWIVRATPERRPVDQCYVIAILVGVLTMGFITDMLGLAIANGSLWLGLAVPDGPPLGSILVEKSETIMMDILLPFSFMYIGMVIDVSTLSEHWSNLLPLFVFVMTGYTIKMVSTLIVCRYIDMTLRDSFTISLILSLRGEVELLLFLHWMDFKMIGQAQFTLLALLSILVTALATPLISIVYDPTRPYMVNKRRTIQHTPPNTELHIVACVCEEEDIYGLLKLIDYSNPAADSPFSVYALHHIELEGRANPVFIDHEKEERGTNQSSTSSVHKALRIFKESRGDYLNVHPYTAITPTRTMYQDICEMALSKQACVIILPLLKEASDKLDGSGATKKPRCQYVSTSVLAHAPCSVGILVDKSPYRNIYSGIQTSSMHHFVVLFLGGPDAREALCYADRASGSEAISLTVIRFLSDNSEGDIKAEKKLDDGLVTSFWVKNEGNERSNYREVVAKNGEETINAIQNLNRDEYDLWIVGRKHGINPVLLRGLPNCRENSELGVIGDYISSLDFSSRGSVLVVQQQVLRGQDRSSRFSRCPKLW